MTDPTREALKEAERCEGSGVLSDWHSGKVRCRSCGRWLWGHYVGAWLAWTPVHGKEAHRA